MVEAEKNKDQSAKTKNGGILPSQEYLSKEELATKLKTSQATIFHWHKKGLFPKYCLGRRAYYKWSEVEQAMTKI